MTDENELPENSARAKIAALEQQIAAVRKEELKKRELILHNFGLQIEALRTEMEETIGIELNRLRADLNKASADLAFYKEEYFKAVLSRSWKITGPLRSATAVKQKIRNLLNHDKPAE
ncbi:MAG TPA: hypothetical protein VH351_19615 [Bryobacteraceae bacterium]|jgi:hypothetical protein|nr:hypothetical protein [Bryobacteraceae bacterium]